MTDKYNQDTITWYYPPYVLSNCTLVILLFLLYEWGTWGKMRHYLEKNLCRSNWE